MYFLGIDGGGTKTRYVIADEKLNILANIEDGTTHIHQVGEAGLAETLSKNINKVCENIGINKDQLTYGFLGMPGYGESEKDIEIIDEVVKQIMGDTPYKIDNDVVVGWAAAMACEPGINIVAGTGSISYGKDTAGDVARSGGWGHVIGDEGSAHWIGVQTIQAYTKQKDGREKKTVLVDVLEQYFNINYEFEITEIVYNKYNLSRDKIAGFSRICYMAAMKGCNRCKKIFKEAAYELSLTVKGLLEKLSFQDTCIVSYTGGVFKSGNLVLDPLKEYLEQYNCQLREPLLEPWYGAVLLAYNLAGNEIKEEDVLKLRGDIYETVYN